MKKFSFIFFLVMFVIGTDTFIISPLIPTLQSTYHIPTAWAGWLVSSYALGYAFFALIAGPISDGMDRKKTMIYGLVVFTLSTFLCGLAPNFWSMILFRFLAGVSASFVAPQVWAAIPMLVKPENIVKTIGYATAGLSVSQLIGLPLGGYLASWSWNAPFYAIALAALVLSVIIASILPGIEPVKRDKGIPLGHIYSQIFKTPRALYYFLAYFLFQAGFFGVYSFIGAWFSKEFSLSVTAIGSAMLILGLGNTIGTVFGSCLVTKIGEPKALFLAIAMLILLYMGLPFSNNIMIAEMFFFFIFLVGGFVFPVFMSTMQSLTNTYRGTVSAMTSAVMYAGTTLGGVLGGLLFAHVLGFLGISILAAILNIITMSVYMKSGLFRHLLSKPVKCTC